MKRNLSWVGSKLRRAVRLVRLREGSEHVSAAFASNQFQIRRFQFYRSSLADKVEPQ